MVFSQLLFQSSKNLCTHPHQAPIIFLYTWLPMKSRVRSLKLKSKTEAFWHGFASAFMLFPATSINLQNDQADLAALRSDWIAVGKDIRQARDKMAAEVQSVKKATQ